MPERIVMPSFGMYTAEGRLVAWVQPSGARVSQGQTILEIETDKAVQEVVAPATGVLHHVAAVGMDLKEEALLGYVLADGEAPPEDSAPSQVAAPTRSSVPRLRVKRSPSEVSRALEGAVAATPIARRLAAEAGIDLAGLHGSGPNGRILEADVRAALARAKTGT